MNTVIKTLKVRVRDKHSKMLRKLAFEANQIWNAANEATSELCSIPIPGIGWHYTNISAFDLQKELKGIRNARNLDICSSSFQEIISVHAKCRKQFKKNKLRWRISSGSKRSLGWVPFKIGAAKWVNGQVRFNGMYFKVWDSFGLSQYEFRSGSFSEDSRGRWYFNIMVKSSEKPSEGKNSIGIDLGLKTVATCSNGEILENNRIYQRLESKIGRAQRAKKKRIVKKIHAKIKNRRNDCIHQFTNKLTKENGFIVIGGVSSAKLAKTNMAKSVLDAGWYMLKTQLKYKAIARSVVFEEVNEKYTTQMCSSCGCISDNSPKGMGALGIREWICSECGTKHDRDINSAINILRLGQQSLAGGISSI